MATAAPKKSLKLSDASHPRRLSLSDALREFRLSKGYTLRQLSALSGVGLVTLHRAERGKTLSALSYRKIERWLERINALQVRQLLSVLDEPTGELRLCFRFHDFIPQHPHLLTQIRDAIEPVDFELCERANGTHQKELDRWLDAASHRDPLEDGTYKAGTLFDEFSEQVVTHGEPMGLELMSLSAKVLAENRIWMEGVKNDFSVGPVRVSVSSLTDSILTFVRRGVASGQINLEEDILQGISRVSREPVTPRTPGTPGTLHAIGKAAGR